MEHAAPGSMTGLLAYSRAIARSQSKGFHTCQKFAGSLYPSTQSSIDISHFRPIFANHLLPPRVSYFGISLLGATARRSMMRNADENALGYAPHSLFYRAWAFLSFNFFHVLAP